MRYLEPGTFYSSRPAANRLSGTMRFSILNAGWTVLLTLLAIAGVGLVACHSVRVVPTVSKTVPEVAAPVRKSVVRVRGHVYGSRDTLNVVTGAELVFSKHSPDSATQRWHDVTNTDGSYQVVVPSGATYQIALSKDGLNIETQEFPVPEGRADTGSVVKNFYLAYQEDVIREDWTNNIYFDYKHAELRPESKERMSYIARVLKISPEIGCVIEGHAEPQEVPAAQIQPEQYLLRLGQRRAQAAYTFLLKMGISESRLNPVSYGARRPAAPNDTPEDRQFNRRVEFKSVKLEFIPAKSSNNGAGSLLKNPGDATSKPSVSGKRKVKSAPGRRPANGKYEERSGK